MVWCRAINPVQIILRSEGGHIRNIYNFYTKCTCNVETGHSGVFTSKSKNSPALRLLLHPPFLQINRSECCLAAVKAFRQKVGVLVRPRPLAARRFIMGSTSIDWAARHMLYLQFSLSGPPLGEWSTNGNWGIAVSAVVYWNWNWRLRPRGLMWRKSKFCTIDDTSQANILLD